MEDREFSAETVIKIKELLKEIDITQSPSSSIQDNKIFFRDDDKTYQIRMPSQHEAYVAEQAQNKLQVQLIQQDGAITKKKLIRLLKEKQDVDIEQLEADKAKLRNQLQELYLDLAVVRTENVDRILEIKAKKQEIESKFIDITIEICNHIKPCIEEQIQIEYYRVLAYLCTDMWLDTDKVERAWKTYDDFLKDNSALSQKALLNLQSLLLNVRQ
jgi:hypothetical protein